ncbi:hypothetical protein NE237_007977 [Protea cynaroides]|uniref:Amino acid transporter transmembrane domain-containing protein n=1 Tax=Protea cynaroides TaxID=273540 RepID=A0A9Q0QWP4_9MAGN|nr:hypothetical protein NE237_007977 [Protea cynaroides]
MTEFQLAQPKELDAGALFVLKSRGSWLHCGYHLTTAIVGPAVLSLPFTFAMLGWGAGLLCLTIVAVVTFYSYNLLSIVLEHLDELGQRQLRFRDMATHILGPKWGRYYVGPLQFTVCYAAVAVCILLGGQSLKCWVLQQSWSNGVVEDFVAVLWNNNQQLAGLCKKRTPDFSHAHAVAARGFSLFSCLHEPPSGAVVLYNAATFCEEQPHHGPYACCSCIRLLPGLGAIYLLSTTDEKMMLYEFEVIFGCLMLILAQIPSFHSLRHVNLIALVLYLAYSACALFGSIHVGKSRSTSHKDYSVSSHGANQMFGIFNAISIIATTYGIGILPEIQATIVPPVKGKMFKGICICYVVIATTFFSVAISGYWAFGNQAQSTILSNFIVDGNSLLPKWLLLMTNAFTLLQVSATTVIYLQPTNEIFEQTFADPTSPQFSTRNIIPRLLSRSFSVVVATLIAAMFPFFGDIMAFIGAVGIIPLDFILPMVFYNVTFRPSKRDLIFWINIAIALVFSALGVLGTVSSVRQIILDSKTYHLFANV